MSRADAPVGDLEIVSSGPLSGSVAAPPSKSVTNRLLVIAALATGESRLVGPLVSDDTEAMAVALGQLGAAVETGRRTRHAEPSTGPTADPTTGPTADPTTGPTGEALCWRVRGTGGVLHAPSRHLDARQSGTTLRFLAPLAVIARGTTSIDGSESLRRRPIGPLADALAALGAAVTTRDGFPPLTISGGAMRGGAVAIDASRSSQFASALLLAAPYAESDVELTVSGLQAGGYVDLTVELMRRFGARVAALDGEERPGGTAGVPGSRRYLISSSGRYVSGEAVVEYDASAAAHLLALGVATGGRVRVPNASPTLQPDAGIIAAFVAMGASVTDADGGIELTGPDQLEPVEVDLATMPDQLPTLAVLAALGRGTSRLTGLGVTRAHESDRLLAVARELARLGFTTRAGEDWLEVEGSPDASRGGIVETYGDHRMAMAFTALGARVGKVVIRDAGVVGKTYPGFFADAARLGLGVLPRG